jgi:tRNA A37 threonylcarbamoyladenosine dehydratase
MLLARSKVAIVGAGNVGSSFAFALMISGLSREIVLIDNNRARAAGIVFVPIYNYLNRKWWCPAGE